MKTQCFYLVRVYENQRLIGYLTEYFGSRTDVELYTEACMAMNENFSIEVEKVYE